MKSRYRINRMSISKILKIINSDTFINANLPQRHKFYQLACYRIFHWLLNNSRFVYQLLYQTNNHFYIFTGVSSSGKTTLLNYLKETEPDLITLECDKIGERYLLTILRENQPQIFYELYSRFNSNLLHYIFCDKERDIFWKRLCLTQSAEKALIEKLGTLKESITKRDEEIVQAIPSVVMYEVNKFLRLGKIVILDMLLNKDEYQVLKEYNPILITIYCKFKNLQFKIAKRNQIAYENNDAKEWRHPLIVYRQFSELFPAKPKTCVDTGLEHLDKKTVVDSIEKATKEIPYNLPRAFKSVPSYKKLITNNFKFNNHNDISTYPSFWSHKNKVICTDNNNLEQEAKQFFKILRN